MTTATAARPPIAAKGATFREALKAVIAATTAAGLANAWSDVAKASHLMHRAKSAEAAARAAAAWARVPDRAPEPEDTALDDDWKSVYEARLAHEHALEVCCLSELRAGIWGSCR